MNPKYLALNQVADSLIKDQTQRCRIITFAVALAVASQSALPSSQVESPLSHFNLTAGEAARHTISAFNEGVIFDAKAALEHTRMFWMLRYNTAFPVARPVYSLEQGFFDALIGVGQFVAPDDQTFLCEQKEAVLLVSNAIQSILEAERYEDA